MGLWKDPLDKVSIFLWNLYIEPLTTITMFLKIFLMWTIFKVFIEFVTVLLLFYVLVFFSFFSSSSFFFFFGCEACGILAPRPGIVSATPALEGEVLTTGPPGKSLQLEF